MMLSRAYWFNNFPCFAASCKRNINQVHGTQYVLNSFAGTDSNNFFSLTVINPEIVENILIAYILQQIFAIYGDQNVYLPQPHDLKLGIFVWQLRRLISELKSEPNSSIWAMNASTFWSLHQSQECKVQWCESSYPAKVLPEIVATILKPHTTHRNQGQKITELYLWMHQSISQRSQTTLKR